MTSFAALNDSWLSADTHRITLPLSGFVARGMDLKDESTHPTGSLKHRLGGKKMGDCTAAQQHIARLMQPGAPN